MVAFHCRFTLSKRGSYRKSHVLFSRPSGSLEQHGLSVTSFLQFYQLISLRVCFLPDGKEGRASNFVKLVPIHAVRTESGPFIWVTYSSLIDGDSGKVNRSMKASYALQRRLYFAGHVARLVLEVSGVTRASSNRYGSRSGVWSCPLWMGIKQSRCVWLSHLLVRAPMPYWTQGQSVKLIHPKVTRARAH